MLLGTAVLSAGCAGQTEKEDTGKEEVSIPIILTVDSSTGIKNEEDVVEAFNEKYDGKWQADVEWIMETEEEYRQNLNARM